MRNLVTAAALAAGLAFASPAAALPDWSGDWVVEGPATLDPAGAGPQYKPEWAARIASTRAELNAGITQDPYRTCGLPAGMPRMLALPDIHEWIVRPEGVWHAVENGGTVRRIYTDGRPHMGENDLFPTHTGDNVGHWEGEVLVVDTIGLRDDTWLDASGLQHSDALQVSQRVRLVAPDRLQVEAVLDDPEAFAAPWRVTRFYKRLPAGSFVADFACKVMRGTQ